MLRAEDVQNYVVFCDVGLHTTLSVPDKLPGNWNAQAASDPSLFGCSWLLFALILKETTGGEFRVYRASIKLL